MSLNATGRLGIIGTVGAILIALGAILLNIYPEIMMIKIKESLKLENGSMFFDAWAELSTPLYMSIYLFDVMNPDDIINNGSKPVLREVGPYVFREYRKKIDINFNNDEDTVDYKELKWFVYEPERSNGSLSDTITTLNVPLTIAGLMSDKLDVIQKFALGQFVRMFKAVPFINKTIDELLFRGYQDELMIFLEKQSGRAILPNGTFGYFYEANYTDNGNFTVFTGVKQPHKFLEVKMWNNATELPWWNDDKCNLIKGSDGSKFNSRLQKSETIYNFAPEFCRTFNLRFEEEVNYKGLSTYKFNIPFSMVASADLNPDNKCFCPVDDDCLKPGVFFLAGCKEGAPIVVSLPHFYLADDRYYDSVIGFNRNKEAHSFMLYVEPLTGFVIKGAKRAQTNVVVKPLNHIPQYKNFPQMVFPLFWLDEAGSWPDEYVDGFYERAYKPQVILTACCYAVIAIGGISLLYVFIFGIKIIIEKREFIALQMKDQKE